MDRSQRRCSRRAEITRMTSWPLTSPEWIDTATRHMSYQCVDLVDVDTAPACSSNP